MIYSFVRNFKIKLSKFEFNKSDEVRFYLTKRGFFSEINNLIFAIYFCELNKKKIIIDTSYFVYEWDNSMQCIFDCKYKLVKGTSSAIRKKELKRFFNSYIWTSIRSENFKNLLKKKEVITRLREIQDSVYVLNNNFFAYEENIFSCKYVGLHIRRGDKVEGESKEADKIDLSIYVSMIPKEFKNFPIFIVTDDENVLFEFQKNYPDKRIYSFFDKNDIRVDEDKFQEADKDYVKNHIIHFLRDIDLLIKSECFIGSYSSNVGRFIALKRNFVNSYSVDCKWDEIH